MEVILPNGVEITLLKKNAFISLLITAQNAMIELYSVGTDNRIIHDKRVAYSVIPVLPQSRPLQSHTHTNLCLASTRDMWRPTKRSFTAERHWLK